jgi:hypothetical protein
MVRQEISTILWQVTSQNIGFLGLRALAILQTSHAAMHDNVHVNMNRFLEDGALTRVSAYMANIKQYPEENTSIRSSTGT